MEDFVEDILIFFKFFENIFFILFTSILSPTGVEVPCALIYSISSVFTFASSNADITHLSAPLPSSGGAVIW